MTADHGQVNARKVPFDPSGRCRSLLECGVSLEGRTPALIARGGVELSDVRAAWAAEGLAEDFALLTVDEVCHLVFVVR